MNEKLLQNLSLLNQVTLECMGLTHERDIAKKFVDAAVLILKADYGYAFYKDLQTNRFKIIYKDDKTPFTPLPPRKTGATQKAFMSKTPVYITSAPQTDWVRNDAKRYMKGVVVIPISYRKNNFGTLDICYSQDHNFTSTEKIICEYIGNSAAQAITIVRLYNRQKQFNKQLEKLVKERTWELEEDRAKDQALLTSIGEGILAVDTDGKITLVNPQAEILLGKGKEELLGNSIFEAQPLYDENGMPVKLHDRPSYQALNKQRKIKVRNYFILQSNGNKIPVSITSTPIILNGKLNGAIQTFHDIIKEREIDKAKSELISLASHQLRTPLSAINWYTEALIKNELGRVNPKQKKYLQEIFNANQKMIELVYDFLNVSRIELGTFVVQLSSFKVSEVAKGILQELKPQIEKKRLKVTEKYTENPGQIQADKKIVRLILQNLLANAVKYTPKNGRVNLEISLAHKGKPKLIINITDTGFGIPKNQHEKVFTKLFRGDNVIQLHTEGTGLGLYIVKSFVDLCKGKIAFKSQVDKGTTFHIELPIEAALTSKT